MGDALDGLRGNARDLRRLGDIHALDGGAQRARVGFLGVPSLVQDDLEHGEGEDAFRAGRVTQPLVGIGRRHGLARLDVHEGARAAAAEGVHAGEGARICHGVDPRLEEIGAEGEEVARLLDGVVRDGVPPEGRPVGRAQGFVAQGLVRDARARAQGPRPLVHEAAEAARLETAHQRDSSPLPPLDEGSQLVARLLLDIVQGRRFPAGLRAAESIRVIEALELGLAADAERASVDGMIGIALELDDAAVAILGHEAAARWTFAAHRREVGGDAGHDAVGRDDVGNELEGRLAEQLLGLLPTARGSHRGAGGSDDPEERAPVHFRGAWSALARLAHAAPRRAVMTRSSPWREGKRKRRERGARAEKAQRAHPPLTLIRSLRADQLPRV